MLFQNEVIYNYLNLIAASIVSITGFITAANAYRKDKTFLGNKLLMGAMLMVGMYGIFVVIEQGTMNEALSNIFGPLEYVSLLFGIIFLYLTMNVIINSSKWLERNFIVWFLFAYAIAFSITIYAWEPAFEVIVTNRTDIKIHPIMLAFFGGMILFVLIYSIFVTYGKGVRNAEGELRKKMIMASLGFVLCIASLILEVLNTFYPEGDWMDVLFFIVFAAAMLFLGTGFSRSH